MCSTLWLQDWVAGKDTEPTTFRLSTVSHTYKGKMLSFLLYLDTGCHRHMCTYHLQQKVFHYYGSEHIFIFSS